MAVESFFGLTCAPSIRSPPRRAASSRCEPAPRSARRRRAPSAPRREADVEAVAARPPAGRRRSSAPGRTGGRARSPRRPCTLGEPADRLQHPLGGRGVLGTGRRWRQHAVVVEEDGRLVPAQAGVGLVWPGQGVGSCGCRRRRRYEGCGSPFGIAAHTLCPPGRAAVNGRHVLTASRGRRVAFRRRRRRPEAWGAARGRTPRRGRYGGGGGRDARALVAAAASIASRPPRCRRAGAQRATEQRRRAGGDQPSLRAPPPETVSSRPSTRAPSRARRSRHSALDQRAHAAAGRRSGRAGRAGWPRTKRSAPGAR